MDVFDLRKRLVNDYASYVRSFINIRDERIGETVERKLREGALWPDPLIQLNPAFEPGASIPEVVSRNLLHEECKKVFAIKVSQLGNQRNHFNFTGTSWMPSKPPTQETATF